MDVTAADIAKIPAENLHIPRDEFVTLWLAAEHYAETNPENWYAAGVVMTTRWIAGATVRPVTGDWFVARSPVTERQARAYEELIAAELLEAEKLAIRRPAWVVQRDTWIDAVVATLNWVWRGGSAPVRIVDPATSAG